MSDSQEVLMYTFDFFTAFLAASIPDDSRFNEVADQFIQSGLAEQAMIKFEDLMMGWKTRCSINAFIGLVFAQTSPRGVKEMILNGQFRLIWENWEMMCFEQVIECLARVVFPHDLPDLKVVKMARREIRDNEAFMDHLSDVANDGGRNSGAAGALSEILQTPLTDDAYEYDDD
jgi:hypothetical protein